ncbi:hypothetical protein ACET3Z_005309 [Daucus carota]
MGKDRLYAEYAFYDNGVLSKKAEEILDAGYLGEYASTFLDNSLDLEAPVGNGLFAKYILHFACLGILEIVVPKQRVSTPLSVSEFMPVDQLLVEMELENPYNGVTETARVGSSIDVSAVGPVQVSVVEMGNVGKGAAVEVGKIDGFVDGDGLSAGVSTPAF